MNNIYNYHICTYLLITAILDCCALLEKIKRGERGGAHPGYDRLFRGLALNTIPGARSVDNVGRFSCGDTLSAAPLRLLKVTRQALTFAETNPKGNVGERKAFDVTLGLSRASIIFFFRCTSLPLRHVRVGSYPAASREIRLIERCSSHERRTSTSTIRACTNCEIKR